MSYLIPTYMCCIRSTSCIRKNGGWNISQIFDKEKETNATSIWQIWNRNSLYQIIETDCFKTWIVFEFQIIYGGNQNLNLKLIWQPAPLHLHIKTMSHPSLMFTPSLGVRSLFYQLLNQQDVSFTFIYSFAFYLLCKWCCNLYVRRLNSIIVLKWLKLKMLTGS